MNKIDDDRTLPGFESRLLDELLPMVERGGAPLPAASTKPGRRRWWLVGAAAALALTVAVALPAILPPGAPGGPQKARGVAFHKDETGYLNATITDPTASAAEMQASFAQHGFDISVYLKPVSPSFVGSIPAEPTSSNQIDPIWGPEGSCFYPGGGTRCQIGIRIPLDFNGSAAIVVGRAAEPGEVYVSSNDAFAPGEALHCSGVLGLTVADAQPILAKLGVTVIWRTGGDDPPQGADPSTIGDQFITDAVAYAAPSTEMITVGPQPIEPGAYQRSLEHGC
jgi:hypothetical protein